MILKELIDAHCMRDLIIDYDDMANPKCIKEIAFGDIGNTPTICLAFECEEETHIEILATHPVLIPLYNCKINSIDVDGGVIRAWIDMKSLYETICRHWIDTRSAHEAD